MFQRVLHWNHRRCQHQVSEEDYSWLKHFFFPILRELSVTFFCSRIPLIVNLMTCQLNYSWNSLICKQVTHWKRSKEGKLLEFYCCLPNDEFSKLKKFASGMALVFEATCLWANIFKNEVCKVSTLNKRWLSQISLNILWCSVCEIRTWAHVAWYFIVNVTFFVNLLVNKCLLSLFFLGIQCIVLNKMVIWPVLVILSVIWLSVKKVWWPLS